MYQYNEKIYKNKIKYSLEERDSEYLLVVFSGYSNHPEKRALYNYGSSLKSINANKLFILDDFGYEGRGVWYIGENGVYDIKEYVYNLIIEIVQMLGIKNEKIITIGSSKGGFAATYFGMRLNVGNIIAGAPQIKLGDYLKTLKRNEMGQGQILIAIIGEDNNGMNFLNKIVFDVIQKNNTKIDIICGKEDRHLPRHVMPFVEKMKQVGNFDNVNLRLIDGGHDAMWSKFKDDMPKIVIDIVKGNLVANKTSNNEIINDSYVKNVDIITYVKEGAIVTKINNEEDNNKYACYLLKDGSVIDKKKYKSTGDFQFSNIDRGEYIVKWFIKKNNDEIETVSEFVMV